MKKKIQCNKDDACMQDYKQISEEMRVQINHSSPHQARKDKIHFTQNVLPSKAREKAKDTTKSGLYK